MNFKSIWLEIDIVVQSEAEGGQQHDDLVDVNRYDFKLLRQLDQQRGKSEEDQHRQVPVYKTHTQDKHKDQLEQFQKSLLQVFKFVFVVLSLQVLISEMKEKV